MIGFVLAGVALLIDFISTLVEKWDKKEHNLIFLKGSLLACGIAGVIYAGCEKSKTEKSANITHTVDSLNIDSLKRMIALGQLDLKAALTNCDTTKEGMREAMIKSGFYWNEVESKMDKMPKTYNRPVLYIYLDQDPEQIPKYIYDKSLIEFDVSIGTNNFVAENVRYKAITAYFQDSLSADRNINFTPSYSVNVAKGLISESLIYQSRTRANLSALPPRAKMLFYCLEFDFTNSDNVPQKPHHEILDLRNAAPNTMLRQLNFREFQELEQTLYAKKLWHL